MADYTPVVLPGGTYTTQASGTITGGDLVVVSGNGTVARAAATAATTYVGVANHDVVNGQKLTITAAKAIHESIADGTVTAGDQLTTTATANRQVRSLAAAAVDVGGTPTQASINTAINTSVNNARAVVGVALSTATDNNLVRWMQR